MFQQLYFIGFVRIKHYMKYALHYLKYTQQKQMILDHHWYTSTAKSSGWLQVPLANAIPIKCKYSETWIIMYSKIYHIRITNIFETGYQVNYP